MKFKKLALAALISTAILVSGCATHLSPGQEREYDTYESKGLIVKEKSVALASVLGVFPIVGYAYVGSPILAVTSVLTWPFLGPIWMPIDVGLAAKNRNYYATRDNVEREKRKALAEIDHRLEDKSLTYEQHIREQRVIEAKYSAF
ncbi:hypothetical protein [Pseudomonas syringae]|uniref:hypothetical protein n=1 Tax=Pseudomonas syringae TaxID=317 RepID=UPI001F2B8D90|nr:hypothetical protein [Pseudomonas syringae]MCF5371258.1 TM2 domain-containing protein [Pseudomonas syringae]MCF5382147.1 TM2 domain-containing protein [Pseudomonas syringae]MCF5423520.1 TM2 domain-containing protein [Pseudomonas syringae]MCF5455345.1 TM2 domain-containing protein [Pseudomonas syringae]MCF5460678.1 TM2 domain-containing protein [Pseudomonas syringae]